MTMATFTTSDYSCLIFHGMNPVQLADQGTISAATQTEADTVLDANTMNPQQASNIGQQNLPQQQSLQFPAPLPESLENPQLNGSQSMDLQWSMLNAQTFIGSRKKSNFSTRSATATESSVVSKQGTFETKPPSILVVEAPQKHAKSTKKLGGATLPPPLTEW